MSDGFIIKRGGGETYAAFKALVDGSLTEVTAEMLDGITVINTNAFSSRTSLSSITIPNGVTIMGQEAFRYCTSLTSVTVKSATPPTLGFGVFYNGSSNLVIYVPAESVDAYKSASGWSTYADRIQAIPSE